MCQWQNSTTRCGWQGMRPDVDGAPTATDEEQAHLAFVFRVRRPRALMWPLLPALSLSDEMRIKERRGTGKEDGNQDGGC